MWVEIKKSYYGPLGSFHAGRKYDLPDRTVERLPKKYYRETCAPWDEGKDVKAIAAADLRIRALNAKAQAKELASQVEALKQKAADLEGNAARLLEQHEPLHKKFGKANAKQQATEEYRAYYKDYQHVAIATAQRDIAIAEAELAMLETQDTEREARQLCKEAGIEFDEPKKETELKNGKTADESERSEQDERTDNQAAENNGPSQNAADTEGQAVSAGQEP